MVIWKDVPIVVRRKIFHIKKIGGRIFNSFCKDWGDIPIAYYNETTGKMEEVVNTRGKAYATRNRLVFRKKDK